MSFITNSGHWAPSEHRPEVPENEPHRFAEPGSSLPYHPISSDEYMNIELQARQVEQARQPRDMWEMVKGIWGSVMRTAYETVPIPRAEFGTFQQRGGHYEPRLQTPTVVSGKAAGQSWWDRYGPYRQPKLSQSAIDAYLQSVIDAQVGAVETQTAM